MKVEESWTRIFLFAAMCVVVDIFMIAVFGGGAMTALMSTITVGVGYAYGSFQVMYLYKKQVHDAIAKLNDKDA